MTATAARRERRERFHLLLDLRLQLPRLSPRARARTEREIARLEADLAPGRGAADRAQRRLDGMEVEGR